MIINRAAAFAALIIFVPNCSYAASCVERDANGRIKRSSAAVREFRKNNPCPGTGLTTGPCLGYVVDHIHPRCHCGEDSPRNMQWQAIEPALEKDKWERSICTN